MPSRSPFSSLHLLSTLEALYAECGNRRSSSTEDAKRRLDQQGEPVLKLGRRWRADRFHGESLARRTESSAVSAGTHLWSVWLEVGFRKRVYNLSGASVLIS